jgi:hypothetical protein
VTHQHCNYLREWASKFKSMLPCRHLYGYTLKPFGE